MNLKTESGITYKKPPYYNKIANTKITIDLNDERQTTFGFISYDKNAEVLGERIYFFDMDEYDINEIIAQLQNVKEKLKK